MQIDSVSYVIQKKQLFHWEDQMSYSTLDYAQAAFPHFQKDTLKQLRIIMRREEVVRV